MSQALRKLTANIKRTNTLVIFINQIRNEDRRAVRNPETTTGGNALKFYASRAPWTSAGSARSRRGDDGGPASETAASTVVEEQGGAAFQAGEFDIVYGDGISREGEVLETRQSISACSRSRAAWYIHNGDPAGQRQGQRARLPEGKPPARARDRSEDPREGGHRQPGAAAAEPAEEKKVEHLATRKRG